MENQRDYDIKLRISEYDVFFIDFEHEIYFNRNSRFLTSDILSNSYDIVWLETDILGKSTLSKTRHFI